jgi:hypothetical protein
VANRDGAGKIAMTAGADAEKAVQVRRFHQILFWPLQLMPLVQGQETHWGALDGDPLWELLEDEFPADAAEFKERHYREFIAFLPHVQRFLYGEHSHLGVSSESPMRAYRRLDVKSVRVWPGRGEAARTFHVNHVDVYFFHDADVMIPVVEISAEEIPLPQALDTINRFGRAYPAGWSECGDPLNCFETVEWLDAEGASLAKSDYGERIRYFRSVARNQAIEIASHWDFLLGPMALNQRTEPAQTGYRPLEFHRMPLMAFLAVDEPAQLSRAEFVRLAFAAPSDARGVLPLSQRYLADFEARHCYDRLYDPERLDAEWSNLRMLCSPQAFVMVGAAGDRAFTDAERGFLGQFRHQYFMLGLIAHFHRAAILMMSDRLVAIVNRLNSRDRQSVARFRHDIRIISAAFLRFTHRYYFCEVSDQAMLRDIFQMWSAQLGTARLFAELREEVNDMEAFMEADMMRRQGVTILQLTVATLFSLIGTITTGFLGMNLFAHADLPTFDRIVIFFSIFIPTTFLTLYTVLKSRRLAGFLDSLANEKLGWGAKATAFFEVWRKNNQFTDL